MTQNAERDIALRHARKWQYGSPRSDGGPRPKLEVDRDWMAFCFVCEADEADVLRTQLTAAQAEIERLKKELFEREMFP